MDERKRDKAIRAELLSIEKKEKRLAIHAQKARPSAWKSILESKLPDNVYAGLESAFCKGFSIVFSKGRKIIEKTSSTGAKQSDILNLTATTLEGIGLGALGIGMPDIVLFLGTLLKGIYETALKYGFAYESRQEQMFILKMMAASLSSGEEWCHWNGQVDSMVAGKKMIVTDQGFEAQINATASVFAADMLLLKFIQGIPIVGIIGGAANPVYYRRVMRYVELKYRKRYLLSNII